jgi:hypothetical protein
VGGLHRVFQWSRRRFVVLRGWHVPESTGRQWAFGFSIAEGVRWRRRIDTTGLPIRAYSEVACKVEVSGAVDDTPCGVNDCTGGDKLGCREGDDGSA